MNNVFIQNKKAQAILELAIFGAILITLLGVLISYGLRYNYQQLTMQRAFRRALATAAASMEPGTPSAVSYSLTEDRHIPDPSQQFAIGGVMPFSSTGSVTRSAAMQDTPDGPIELPLSTFNINGEILTFKSAGFREEWDIPDTAMERYVEIYGTVQAYNATVPGGWAYWEDGTKECIEEGPPDAFGQPTCLQYSYNHIRYIDDCAGELMTYETTKRQCRKIIDSRVCQADCERGGGTDCASICSQPMEVPWYCGGDYEEIDAANHVYVFPFLDTLFAFSKEKDKSMGLQSSGYAQRDTANASVRRKDTPAAAETTDNIEMNTHSERQIVSKTYGDESTLTNTQTVATDTQRKQRYIWRTPWD